MKGFAAIGVGSVLGLVSCSDFSGPIGSGDFDPLRPPGSQVSMDSSSGQGFKGGQFVRAVMDNTAFYLKKPEGDADADKLLPRGASMKVVSQKDNYVKVELDSGEVGFVPTVMVEDPNAVPVTDFGAYQVYPPLGGFEAVPTVPMGEAPPEGAIPTVIDPEAPASDIPAPTGDPKVDPIPNLPPAGNAPNATPPAATGGTAAPSGAGDAATPPEEP